MIDENFKTEIIIVSESASAVREPSPRPFMTNLSESLQSAPGKAMEFMSSLMPESKTPGAF